MEISGTCVITLTCLLSQIKLRLKSLLLRGRGSRQIERPCPVAGSVHPCTLPPYESALESSLITALSKKIRFYKREVPGLERITRKERRCCVHGLSGVQLETFLHIRKPSLKMP